MGKIRGELEDLAFQHLEPEAYEDLIAQIDEKRQPNEEFLHEIQGRCRAEARAAKAFRRGSKAG